MEMLCAIKIRSSIKKSSEIKAALDALGLRKTNSCVLLSKNKSNQGLMKKAESVIAYGEINKETLAGLLKKRAMASKSKRFDWSSQDPAAVAQELLDGKKNLKEQGIRRVFNLHPPRKGFGRMGKKAPHNLKGAFGYWGSDINNLIERMI